MSKKPIRIALLAMLALGACGEDASNTGPVGSMDLNLQLAGDVDLDSVDYEITGNGIAPINGTIDVAGQSSVFFQIRRIPEGQGFLLELDAVDGTTTCSASANFDITAGQVEQLTVVFICDRSADTGSVEVSATSTQFCARITDMNAAAQNDGAAYAVNAVASDEDGDLITFTWSAPTGSFVTPSSTDPATASTTFNCGPDGNVALTVSVSDDGFDACSESETIEVTCSGGATAQATPAIAYRANQDSTSNQELFVSGWDGSGNQKISGSIQPGTQVLFFRWRPDGTKMAFTADREIDDITELYVVDADGTNLVKINPSGADIRVSDTEFEWSPDGSRIAYLARQGASGPQELYTNLPDGTDNRIVYAAPPSSIVGVRRFLWRPDSSELAFIADEFAAVGAELFIVTALGTNQRRVHATYSFPQSISTGPGSVAWSPNGQWIAYVADQDTGNQDELYVGRPDVTLTVKVSGSLQPNGDVDGNGPLSPFAWSPDSNRLAYRADANQDGRFELFTTTRTGSSNFPASGPVLGSGVEYFSWSPNGSVVAFTAPVFVPTRPELYTFNPSSFQTTQIGNATSTGVSAANPFDPAFIWVSGGSRIIYRGDSLASPGQIELFNAPVSGGGTIRVNGALPPGASVDTFVLSPDQSRVAYLADQDVVGELSLYVSTTFGGANARLSGPSLSGDGVTSRIGQHETVVWSADSSRVAYLNDEEVSQRSFLYTSTPDGLVTAKANGTMVSATSEVSPSPLEWRP